VAIASKQAFFSAVVSLASWRDAAFACLASNVICSVKVMQEEGKPKSQTEKCEVSRFPEANSPALLLMAGFLHGNFYKVVAKKGLAGYRF
jgi:hypothetical protein